MSKRACPEGFLKEYVRYTQDTEVLDFFALWCGIAIINACLGRKCYIDLRSKVFPNLYTIVVGESAFARKSTAINQALGIMKMISNPPRVFAQKTTPEAFIASLKEQDIPSIKDSRTGQIIDIPQAAEGIFVVDELITLLGTDSYKNGFLGLLTKIYDSSEEEFSYETRSHGAEIIRNPCISLLGGTTVGWIRSAIPMEAVGGGFTSRVVFVKTNQKIKPVALPEMTSKIIATQQRLVTDLGEIRELTGPFLLTQKAKDYFSDIYNSFLLTTPFRNDKALSSYAGRRHTNLHKVAMAICVSRTSDMVITDEDYAKANEILKNTEVLMPSVMNEIMATADGEYAEDVLRYIQAQGEVTRSLLTRKFQHKVSATTLEEFCMTLERAGYIKLIIQGRSAVYRATDDMIL